ncbi:MAG: nucleoside monophosphate kinase [Elusimicrobia bacterium]|nr:nucleoside monophosphate kinase [Elusimicrobiota bacterium]
MNIILLGPQGSGKGTQAQLLVAKFGFNHFEAGKILRSIANSDNPNATAVKQALDGGGDRGREHQGLAPGGDLVEDLRHVREESHVEHAVGLVEDDGRDGLEAPAAGAPHVVEEASGRRDGDVGGLLQGLGLRRHRLAADDEGGLEARVLRQVGDGGFDLRRQLADRGEDEGARPRAGRLGQGHQALQGGQGVGHRLAAAGLRGAQHVEAVEGGRDGGGLDGGRVLEAHPVDRLAQGGVEAEDVEAHVPSFRAVRIQRYSWR